MIIALYHFCVKQIKRSAGQSAIAAAAYRAGEKLYSDYYGDYSDYTRKGGVIYSEIILPPHAPPEYRDRQTLWNAVEFAEKNKRAQLAYSFDIALQNELTMDENIELAREFVQKAFVDRGMIADLAIHQPDKGNGGISNPHFHVMTTMRPLNSDGTWGKKQKREYLYDDNGDPVLDKQGKPKFNAVATTDWHCPETLEEWRGMWCEMVNDKFAEKGLNIRIDHRSYKRQGLDLIPTIHEGPTVRQMEKKGIATEKGELNRWIKATNCKLREVKDIISSLISWIAKAKAELNKPQTPNPVDLLFRYYDGRNAGAYSQTAKVRNLKELADTVNYLRANQLFTLDDLKSRLSEIESSYDKVRDDMKSKEKRMELLKKLIDQGQNYLRLKPVHNKLNSIKWKKQRENYKSDNDSELRSFYASRRILKQELGDKPISIKDWQRELDLLKHEYTILYTKYTPLKEELAKLRSVRYHVSRVMDDRKNEPQRKVDQISI